MRISVYGGKYTFIQKEGDYKIFIERYGEPWLEISQESKAISALLYEFDELQDRTSQ